MRQKTGSKQCTNRANQDKVVIAMCALAVLFEGKSWCKKLRCEIDASVGKICEQMRRQGCAGCPNHDFHERVSWVREAKP
jgi:hypothetical protein